MINYRVDDLVGFLEHLQSRGAATGQVEEHNDSRYPDSEGKFTWITYPEDNHIELYQPI